MSGSDERRGPARLAVFLSGAGRTLANIARAIERGELNARIVLVAASRPCGGAERAEEMGLPVRVIPGVIDADVLEQLLDENRVDWVVLAGYLELLPIPERWRGRVVNIHPALLPGFGGPGMYGDRVHRAVLESGASESGCTVHLCDSEFDTGPIVLQRTCPVLEGDTPETLGERVFRLETEAYPEALRRLIENSRRDNPPAQGRPADGPRIEGPRARP